MSRRPTEAQRILDQILSAYRRGWFPMADVHTGAIQWHNPETRGVIPLDGLRISRSLRQRVRSGRFVVTSDRAFTPTIVGCADPHRPGAWIDETIVRTYRMLHDAGYAHSLEAWLPAGEDGKPLLVGGLYGVAIGGAFFGESMFSRPDLGGTDASKVCLVHLVAHLRRRGYRLLDTQMWSWHLESLGCQEVERDAFLPMLAAAVRVRVGAWAPFEPSPMDAEPSAPETRRLPGR